MDHSSLEERLQALMQDAPSGSEALGTSLEQRISSCRTRAIAAVRDFPWQFDTCGEEPLEEMLRAAKLFCFDLWMDFPANPERPAPFWLTLFGPSEIGKTHLAHAIFRFHQEHLASRMVPTDQGEQRRKRSTIFLESIELARICKAKGFDGDAWLDGQSRATLFVLDDLSADTTAPSKAEIIYYLIATRSAHGTAHARWTVLTSNLDLELIGRLYDARMSSRLRRGANVIVSAPAALQPYLDR